MRIIHTVAGTRIEHGGTSRSIPATCDALLAAGHDVHLVVGVPADDSIASNFPRDRSGVHQVRESAVLGRLLVGRGFQSQLGQLWHNARCTVIHDHGMWLPSNWAAAQFADRHHVPRIISPRGMLSDWAMRHHKWKKAIFWRVFQQRLLKAAAGFHVTSELEADDVRRAGSTQPIAVIPNGLDLPEEMPKRRRSGPRQVLFLSRIHRKKGISSLLNAWKNGSREGRAARGKEEQRGQTDDGGWRLVIAGPDEGGHLTEVRSEVDRLGLRECVSFPGPISDADKWQLYVDSDLFVLPSFSENFGIVVAEAMAAGLPVITTTGTPWQLLRDQQLGWWVDTSADALAEALSDAWSRSPDELREMGRRASEYARREFSWQRVAKELVGFYEQVLGS